MYFLVIKSVVLANIFSEKTNCFEYSSLRLNQSMKNLICITNEVEKKYLVGMTNFQNSHLIYLPRFHVNLLSI